MPLVNEAIVSGEEVDAGERLVQDPPPFREYSMLVTGEPPLFDGPEKLTMRAPNPAEIDEMVGADGVVTGVALEVEELVPGPAELMARITIE